MIQRYFWAAHDNAGKTDLGKGYCFPHSLTVREPRLRNRFSYHLGSHQFLMFEFVIRPVTY